MLSSLSDLSCRDFSSRLASKAPVPGGGGAAALTGSLAAALGAMATNLTVGKKKFLPYEEDHKRILAGAEALRLRFLELIEEDAKAFEPLSQAYSMDRSDPAFPQVMTEATLRAAAVPLEMMRCCCALTELLEELPEKCSALLLSDVGCAAFSAGAALESASLNVFVNTRLLPENAEAVRQAEEAASMLERYLPRIRAVSDRVMLYLRSEK